MSENKKETGVKSTERIFLDTLKHHIENFRIIIKGEFEVKSEETDFVHEFEIESDHINTAISLLKKQINIAVLNKCKSILKDLIKGEL